MRFTLASLLLIACAAPSTDSDTDSGSTQAECPSEALPALTDALTINAYVYDPVAACWSYTTVDMEADLWAAYGPSDTGGVSCDDITVMVPRVDCSCVNLSSSCGDVASALAADPAVDRSEGAYTRCTDLEAERVECP